MNHARPSLAAVLVLIAPIASASVCTERAELVPPDAVPGLLAASRGQVDVAGDWLAVGAPLAPRPGGTTTVGAVHLFHFDGVAWSLSATLQPSEASATARFGFSVALTPSTLVVGAPGDDGDEPNTGAVYGFGLVGGTWSQSWRVAGADSADVFGWSVAISGKNVVVGAPGGGFNGVARVLTAPSGDFVQTLFDPEGDAGDAFGESVAIHGYRIVVGAPGVDEPVNDAGAAVAFRFVGTGWVPWPRLEVTLPAALARYGSSVAIQDHHAVLGGPGADSGSTANCGAVTVFRLLGPEWFQVARVLESPPTADAEFGSDVAWSGDRILVGAPRHLTSGVATGAICVLAPGGPGYHIEETLVPSSSASGDRIGAGVAGSGRWVVGGAPGDSSAAGMAGAARVFECPRSTSPQVQVIAWLTQACGEVGLLAFADDPDGDAVTGEWTSACAGVTFSPSSAVSNATATVPLLDGESCWFTYTAHDDDGLPAGDTGEVTFQDQVPPAVTSPDDLTTDCTDGALDAWLAQFSATDCTLVTNSLQEVVQPSFLPSSTCDIGDVTLIGAAAEIHGCSPAPCESIPDGAGCLFRLVDDFEQAGAVWRRELLSLAGEASFSTHFCFRVREGSGAGDGLGADGFAFLIAAEPDRVGLPGGGIGYAGLDHSVAVEFDTFTNPQDPDGNHAGISIDGDVDSVVTASVAAPFNDGSTWHAWIDYNGSTRQLEVRAAPTSSRPSTALLTRIVDIPEVLGENAAFIGITSATGAATGIHEIRCWEMVTVVGGAACQPVRHFVLEAADSAGSTVRRARAIRLRDVVGPSIAVAPVEGCFATVQAAIQAVQAAAVIEDACSSVASVLPQATPTGCTTQVTLRATDACGNVTLHTTGVPMLGLPPVLAPAPAAVTLSCVEAVPPQEAIAATDDCGPPDVAMSEVRIDGPCAGTYQLQRSWIATDACGQEAMATQVVSVVDDQAPAIAPGPDVAIACDEIPPAPLAAAVDGCDAVPGLEVVETRIDGPCPQQYRLRRRWTATDACGNVATADQWVDVTDTTPPQIAGVPADVTVSCAGVPSRAAASAVDACGAGVVETVVPDERLDGACPHSYLIVRRWQFSDACGNVAEATQTITVRDDAAPVLAGVPADVEVACDAVPAIASPIASDACDAAPVLAFTEQRMDGPCPQTYELQRTWTATDACGNAASATQRIVVRDEVAPVLAAVPADADVACDAVPAPATPTATDSCDAAPVLAFTELSVDGPCPQTYELHRTWTATDACGNATSATQRIVVRDVVAPVLAGVPADADVACDAVPTPATPTATDACDAAPVLAFSELRVDGPCPQSYELHRTWTATDACGNAASATQRIVVRDEVAPVLAGVPADVEAACDAVPAPATPTATDACDAAPALAFSELRVDGPCPQTYELHRTWTATDACGNAATATQRVSVVDRIAPVITPGSSDLHCLWPPNHRMHVLAAADFAPEIRDACSEAVTWRFESCASDQPDDGTGDGSTEGDCIVAADGQSFAVRAERDGARPQGRRHAIRIVATDACGNDSPPTLLGHVLVPHDGRGGGCRP